MTKENQKETIVGRGAEAILIRKDGKLIKQRIKKSYRLPQIDEKLKKIRTRKESKLLEKAFSLIPTPNLIKSSDKSMEIDMEFIEGKKLSEHLDQLPNAEEICQQIGKNIALLHDHNIIHGDLTTSNMIYVENSQQDKKNKANTQDKLSANNGFKVFFIDYGLGFESDKAEDKAVDLHLIKQALEAKHFLHFEQFWKAIEEGYKTSKHHTQVLTRLKAVEKRGRYKQAY
ncbi:MAG: KEOPS complex kinase/ATPase Bud32 [Candidatus Nanoarchaeia archaeon]|nr:KEOPS complex kinase/ATPase Bud32 [Candidatus Nanoarchaeia archaeon]